MLLLPPAPVVARSLLSLAASTLLLLPNATCEASWREALAEVIRVSNGNQ